MNLTQITKQVFHMITSTDPKTGATTTVSTPILEQAAEAAMQTIDSPTPSNLIADVELGISLYKQFKAQISGLHPTAWEVIKLLI